MSQRHFEKLKAQVDAWCAVILQTGRKGVDEIPSTLFWVLRVPQLNENREQQASQLVPETILLSGHGKRSQGHTGY